MVKRMEAFGCARQLVTDTLGNAGSESHGGQSFIVGGMLGKENAQQMVVRHVAPGAANALVTTFFSSTPKSQPPDMEIVV
jgi:hypothetical protein